MKILQLKKEGGNIRNLYSSQDLGFCSDWAKFQINILFLTSVLLRLKYVEIQDIRWFVLVTISKWFSPFIFLQIQGVIEPT